MVTATRGLHGNPPYLLFKTLLSGSTQATALATVLISVCRAIKICRPFDHRIRGDRVTVFIVVMCVVGFGVEVADAVVGESCTVETHDRFRDYKRVYYTVMLVVSAPTILTANLLTISVLKEARNESDEDDFMDIRPTVTIIVLSTIFSFFSFLVLVHLVLLLANVKDDPVTIYFFFFGVPLNSALNPFVYIIRNEQMQVFVRSMFCSCRPNERHRFQTRQISSTNLHVNGVTRDYLQLNGIVHDH